MFLSESIVRVIHADRVREIERSARDRRMIEAASEVGVNDGPADRDLRAVQPPRRDRTGVPA
jgi:hypothetical protein